MVGRYLVTGGAGFIGSHIAESLVRRGDRVRVLDDFSSGLAENLDVLGVGPVDSGAPVELVRGSISSASACRVACEGVEAVFHEAALVSVPRSFEDPLLSYEINVMGTLRLLEAARKSGVRAFIFSSSSAAYGDSPSLPKREDMRPEPLSPYASGKLAGEHLLRVWGRAHGMKTASLRYFNVFGPRQRDDNPYTGVVALFARAVLEGRRATIQGDGEQTRDFTYIDNVVHANLLALEKDLEPGTVINVGGGDRISIRAIYSVMARIAGSTLEPIHVPPRVGDVRDSLASLDRARALLGYEPRVGWEAGLATTMAWYRGRLSAARA
jgi:nucleoside-diphosphate-sugar epimerase